MRAKAYETDGSAVCRVDNRPLLTMEEVSIVVRSAHLAACDISAASLRTVGELSERLSRVSVCIEDALRNEGL